MLFRHKNIMPARYYSAGPAERRVIKVFLMQEIEETKKENEELKRKMSK